jgi:hypothetical protein
MENNFFVNKFIVNDMHNEIFESVIEITFKVIFVWKYIKIIFF